MLQLNFLDWLLESCKWDVATLVRFFLIHSHNIVDDCHMCRLLYMPCGWYSAAENASILLFCDVSSEKATEMLFLPLFFKCATVYHLELVFLNLILLFLVSLLLVNKSDILTLLWTFWSSSFAKKLGLSKQSYNNSVWVPYFVSGAIWHDAINMKTCTSTGYFFHY